ncbi:hypothetical protein EZS27_037860 [termite gut metagenome]|uniref:Bro-N domain-containing protein n=1 Tax=termite gut metagenome TaxID=433724 RepID=A0A5J4PRI3_9ZZZZ
MKKTIITITDNGTVTVSDKVKMNISEIADLFGIFHQTAKRCVRAIEESGIAGGDYSMCGTTEGLKVCPDYYGLDMVVAVAFRVQSAKAEIFRRWIMKKVIRNDMMATLVVPLQNALLN